MNITWAELKNRNPFLFQIIIEDTTRVSYLQRLGSQLFEVMHDLYFPESNYVEMTGEQIKAWAHIVPGNIFIDEINPDYKWRDELEEYEYALKHGDESESELDMYDYYDALEQEDEDAFREDERELDAEWAMLEQSYRHQRRRERSEAAHQRQISELAASMHYRRQDDGSYIERQFGNIVEDERELRAMNQEVRLVYKYDRTRRQRLYRSGASAAAAIAEQLSLESYRSRPGGFGISRQAKKLQRRIYQAYEDMLWAFPRGRAERKLDRLLNQLKRVKKQMAKTKKYKGQNSSQIGIGDLSETVLGWSTYTTDDYLIGCDPDDDNSSFGIGDLSADEYMKYVWPFDDEEDEAEKVSLTEVIRQSIAAKQKRISELRSYEFPEENPNDQWQYGSFNASLRSEINRLKLEINELQRQLNPQT